MEKSTKCIMKHFHLQLTLLCVVTTTHITTFSGTDAFPFINNNYRNPTKTILMRGDNTHYKSRSTSSLNESINKSSNNHYSPIQTTKQNEGIYRPFLNYAWDKLSSSSLVLDDLDKTTTTKKKIYNSSPSKGPDGTVVNVEIQSINGGGINDNENGSSSLRLARYALLETMTPSSKKEMDDDDDDQKEMMTFNQGIHVLNLVLFPNVSEKYTLPLPVLGMDLVTLPGGKHLIAIDFQPVLPIQNGQSEHTFIFPTGGEVNTSSNTNVIYTKYENKIKEIHQTYVLNHPNEMPWGGDIPQPAKRFFSPYALWTRLKDDNALDIIQNQIYIAFCAYFDLYIELLEEIQNETYAGGGDLEMVMNGHRDYLRYRKDNDPARPMLTRLYGNDWTEEIISEVLFKMI